MIERIALYAGSFDPYTNGHHAIVRKAAALFDGVVVMIAVNLDKTRAFDAEAMRGAIEAALAADGCQWLTVKPTAHPDSINDLRASHAYLSRVLSGI